MPFVQEAALTTALTPSALTPTTAVTQASSATQATSAALDATPSIPVDSTTVAPQTSPAVLPSTEVVSDAKPSVAADAKAEVGADVKPEVKAEPKSPAVTITKSETVTTPLAPKSPGDSIWLFTWLPLVIMMGLWLYFRGRNQAAHRARAEALLATSTKKSKKAARPQASETDDASGSVSQGASERIGKGNSKKNKKDKQNQKKKQQQINSDATTAKPNSTTSAGTSSPVTAHAANVTGSARSNSEKVASASSSALAAASVAAIALPTERKSVAPAAQPAKAIFEPLRKVTASARIENTEVEGDESEEQEYAPVRSRRPSRQTTSPLPPVITTPAKVSSGRFEKLNLPLANAGLGASSANRWPAEVARPVATVRPQQPSPTPQADSTPAQAEQEVAPAPMAARGLGAFVKLAKPNTATESAAMESVETKNESNGT